MMSDLFFSVVIPTYNRAGFIATTIGSVLKQEYKNFEVIVVDDGSTDETAQVVQSINDQRIKYFKKTNGERGAARNFGFQRSKGDYINFLDSDDIIYDHHLSIALDFVNRHDQPPVFHLGYDVRTREGKLTRTVSEIDNVNEKLLRGNFLSCNGVFIRRSVMENNLFNEDRELASLEDWELWLRLAARFKILHCNSVTSSVIHHDERSVISTGTENIKQKVERFVRNLSLDPEARRVFGKKLSVTVASAWSYAALHLAMAGAPRDEVIQYLRRAISENSGELLRKRFFVILKLLAFSKHA